MVVVKANQGSTKFIGPMADQSQVSECPTGWCDEQNGQFCAPPDWGASSDDKSRSPKMGAKKPT